MNKVLLNTKTAFFLNHKYAIVSNLLKNTNRIFIIGGSFNMQNAFPDTYEYLPEKTEIVTRAQLN